MPGGVREVWFIGGVHVDRIYRSAIVGVGKAGAAPFAKGGGHRIGYIHSQAYQAHPRMRLVAGADINGDNLAAWQHQFGVDGGAPDFKQMLEQYRPEIVSICTYLPLHRRMIESAAEAGVLGIFCEKPFLASPLECAEVEALAKRTGIKIVVSYIRRQRPIFKEAARIYLSGGVGRPVLCTQAIEGWDLSEMGSHTIDLFRSFHRDVPAKWVMGQARIRDTRGYGHRMEDHAVAIFEFEGGGRGMVDGGRGMNDAGVITLHGTDGSIRIVNERQLVIDTPAGRSVTEFDDPYGPQWIGCFSDTLSGLVGWIEGSEPPVTGLPNALKTSELNLAAYLSALQGDRIDLPLSEQLSRFDAWPIDAIAERDRLAATQMGNPS